MYMPLMIDLEKVVVFGGEREEGLQKTEKMAVFGDEVVVIPETDDNPGTVHLEAGDLDRVPESLSLDEARHIPVADHVASEATIESDIEGATFVTSDLDDERLNRLIAEACEQRNILCNIIDVKELCDTWLMSVIDTPNMIAGLSSKGSCAFYAQRTRIELEDQFEHRSGVSGVFTELRNSLRDQQCALCALDIVYRNEEMQELLQQEQWDQAVSTGRELAKSVPDNHHVMDHSVPDPD